MVKISFQSVAGQKVEKENDGDKTEILIPHPLVSSACPFVISLIDNAFLHFFLSFFFLTVDILHVPPPPLPARLAAPARPWAAEGDFDTIYRHLVGNKTCHCCDGFLCASALIAASVQVITVCKRIAPLV